MILLLKDQFNDFEELKVLTPAREEALNLLSTLAGIKEAQGEINQVIAILPNILKSVEQDNWISRYNFFLLLKGFISK